ncbi:efflux transporter outer membrane subunit [Polaromonas sp.]|uniref:efflux transporter outer membrane subunit n=1 Tax=Polaromonas sp. TaxID=1869339 RepID=UPI003BAB45C9
MSRFSIHACRAAKAAIATAVVTLLASCAMVGPDYHAPAEAVPAQWAAPLPHGASLQKLGDWWEQFNEPVLLKLQEAAEADSPTLAAAWGNIELARATLATARSGGVPAVSANASAGRSRQLASKASSTRSASFDASWELDLFGKVRRNVESADAQVQARSNDWHDARVSLAAEVATSYVQYRTCGQLVETYEQELNSTTETAKATESLVRAGLSAGNDAALARAAQASTTSTLFEQRSQCELLVKSLGNLTGLQDATLRQLLVGSTTLPTASMLAVEAVPAEIVRQRPDVASRERDLASASAAIGVAEANRYPSLSLAGSIGFSAGGGSSASTWSFGPSLSLPLLDGGARRAAVAGYRASYEIAYAQWRDTVRNAVTEVEKTLVQLDYTGQRAVQAESAAREYHRYLAGAEAERRAGSTSLLTYEEARRQALNAQVELVGLQRDNVVQWVALYKALGGGWETGAPATPPASRAP